MTDDVLTIGLVHAKPLDDDDDDVTQHFTLLLMDRCPRKLMDPQFLQVAGEHHTRAAPLALSVNIDDTLFACIYLFCFSFGLGFDARFAHKVERHGVVTRFLLFVWCLVSYTGYRWQLSGAGIEGTAFLNCLVIVVDALDRGCLRQRLLFWLLLFSFRVFWLRERTMLAPGPRLISFLCV